MALLLSSTFSSTAQNINSRVDLEDFKEAVFTDPLLDMINKVRQEKSLPLLTYNATLSKAAKDQAEYNRKMNAAGSEQASKKKASPFDRVLYHKGLFQKVEEFDLGIEIQTKTILKGGRKQKNPGTYQETVNYIVEEWIGDRNLSDILYAEDLHQIGFGFAPNQIDGLLFASLVVASEPYEKENGFKYHAKSYKIAPYEKNTCKNLERNFEYLDELFSDNFIIKKRKIYFYYHDLNLIESLLQTNRDGLGVDILKKDQFACEKGNSLHPSGVYDGMMLKPLNKSKLLKWNTRKEAKEFMVELGHLPAGLDTNDIALSLIVIQDKCACKKIPYNNLNGENIRLLDFDLVVDTISIAEKVDSNSRYLSFVVPFEKNKYDYMVEDIKPFLDSIQLNRFNIKEIEINAFSSIEGNPVINEKLQQKRAESILLAIHEYQLQEVQTKVITQENWDGFIESIKGSPYEGEYRGKSHDEIRAIVNSDTLKYDLEPYLKDQRKAEIKIFVESIYIDSLNNENLLQKFNEALLKKDHIRALAIQTLMYKAVLRGELNKSVLFDGDILQYKEYVPLLNNRLAFIMKFDGDTHSDSLIDNLKMNFEALLGVDPANGHVNFNKQAIKLYYWAKDLTILKIDEENHIDEVKDFYRDIRKLYNTKIDNYFVNRLLLNYNIIAADFYYENQDYKNRVRSLKQVRKYVKKANLSRDQTFVIARYFIFQMQIDWAIQIMQPFVKNADYNEDFLLTFLSIAVYDEKQVPPDKLHEYFKTASETYPGSLCKLFERPGMSVEFFSDIRLKSLYCASCK